MEDSLKGKINRLNRKIKQTDLKERLKSLKIDASHQLQAVQTIADDIQSTELDGIPFQIALMRSKLIPEKTIAVELDLPLKTVHKYTSLPGFKNLLSKLTATTWSDLILASQQTIMFHIVERRDVDLAKWMLEVTGQVASSRPMTNHTHQTLVLNGDSERPKQLTGETVPMTVENLASAFLQRMNGNQKEANKVEPPIIVSED